MKEHACIICIICNFYVIAVCIYIYIKSAIASGKTHQEQNGEQNSTVNRIENKKLLETTTFRVPVAVSRNTLREIMLVIIPQTKPLAHVHVRIFSTPSSGIRARVRY